MQESECSAALIAFAEMKLDRWHGLPRCTRSEVAAALGPGTGEHPGEFGSALRYPGRAGTPYGVEVWFDGDRAVLLVAYSPVLSLAELDGQLGEPEARAPSRLFEPTHAQQLYPSRGLSVHVDKLALAIGRIYGFAPMTLEELQKSPIFSVEASEHSLP